MGSGRARRLPPAGLSKGLPTGWRCDTPVCVIFCYTQHPDIPRARRRQIEGSTVKSAWQSLLLQLCQFNRLHQDYPGRWRLCEFLDGQSHHLASLPPVPIKVARNTLLHLDPGERFDGLKTIIYGLNPKEPLSNIALQLLRPGDNVLDVGANVGYFSALASMAVGPQGRVLAFEASPSTHQRLQTLVGANAYDNVRTMEVAVADKAGELKFHCGPLDHTGTASLRDLAERTSAVTRVKAIALDDLLDTLPPVRLIKIDVEGAEALVLKGMSRLLGRDQPYVLTEVTDTFLRSMGSGKTDLIQAYQAQGYAPFRIGRTVAPYVDGDEFQCDVLMVPGQAAAVNFSDSLTRGLKW